MISKFWIINFTHSIPDLHTVRADLKSFSSFKIFTKSAYELSFLPNSTAFLTYSLAPSLFSVKRKISAEKMFQMILSRNYRMNLLLNYYFMSYAYPFYEISSSLAKRRPFLLLYKHLMPTYTVSAHIWKENVNAYGQTSDWIMCSIYACGECMRISRFMLF